MEVFHSEKINVLLSDLRGPCEGRACTSSHSQRRPTEHTSVGLPWGQGTTHKLSTVYMPVPLDKLVDVSVLHPLGNQSKPVFI